MPEVPFRPVARRNLLDGGFALVLLAVAFVVGYGVLAPASLRAKTLSHPGGARATGRQSVSAAREMPNGSAVAAPATSPTGTAPSTAGLAVPAAPSGPEAGPPSTPGPAVQPDAAPRPAWSTTVTGRVLDPRRQPVAGASVVAGGRELRADADGSFSLEGLPPGVRILVKVPGFEKATLQPAEGPIEVVLRPHTVKAAYLTYYGFSDRGIRSRVLDLVNRTELNAVVVDVKGDRGWVLYRTEVPQALAIGARGPATVRDFDALMADFKARGVYTIARVVVFKDNVLATQRPDLAIIDTRTGKPWVDRESLAWVDPFREEVWDYNLAIAEEAVRKGFDEVQFDYVRFPTDGKLAAARYSRSNTRETRLPTIAAFLERARRQLGPLGAFVGADIFGYTAFNENDTDIGQRVEELAAHVDFLCPMVYPSGYHLGIPGYRNPVAHPYQVVYESVRLIRKRSNGHPVRVRPWLQDFRDYAFDRRPFGVSEIRAQIKAADDGGGIGWMLWNPRNDYTGAALRQKGPLAAK